MEALPARNFIIDGELVALDAAGLPSFDDLTRRDCDATLCAFDILFDEGRDLRGQPMSERRQRLGTLLDRPLSCIVMPCAFAEGRELLTFVEKMGLEGIVSKRLDNDQA